MCIYETQSSILCILYNRPKKTKLLINNLRQVKPKRIYFAVDGPKDEKARKSVLEVQIENPLLPNPLTFWLYYKQRSPPA